MSSIVRPIAGRAMHLQITPRPSNLGESREIMRLLSQFGEIEHYQNFKYAEHPLPNTAIVMYKEKEAADDLLRRSPIRFRMGRASAFLNQEAAEKGVQEHDQSQATPPEAEDAAPLPRGPLGAPFGLGGGQTRSMSTAHQVPRPRHDPRRTQLPFAPILDHGPSIPESRIFQIQVNISTRNLRDHVNFGHYHGNFAIDTKMVGQGDLAKKVPTPGLSNIDWKAFEKPWHVTRAEIARDTTGPTRRRRFGELWEEGQKQKEKEKEP